MIIVFSAFAGFVLVVGVVIYKNRCTKTKSPHREEDIQLQFARPTEDSSSNTITSTNTRNSSYDAAPGPSYVAIKVNQRNEAVIAKETARNYHDHRFPCPSAPSPEIEVGHDLPPVYNSLFQSSQKKK